AIRPIRTTGFFSPYRSTRLICSRIFSFLVIESDWQSSNFSAQSPPWSTKHSPRCAAAISAFSASISQETTSGGRRESAATAASSAAWSEYTGCCWAGLQHQLTGLHSIRCGFCVIRGAETSTRRRTAKAATGRNCDTRRRRRPQSYRDEAIMHDILAALELNEANSGVWSADGGWSQDESGPLIESVNPATGQVLGRVRAATAADYERLIVSARRVFEQWRSVPAPRRGEAVRLIADELRRCKDALGDLVSLETGKIKAEGDGEVQEMIDIADFAVGQSRMLYGLTMHSERPMHRMYEQWHPLGVVAVISAFNFPVAVWSWNAFLAAVCGDVTVWKPSPKAPLCAVAVQKLVNRVLEQHGLPGVFQLFIP